jgi:hypothetical protein
MSKYAQPVEGKRDMTSRPNQPYNAVSRPVSGGDRPSVNKGADQRAPESQAPKFHSAGRLEGNGYATSGPSRSSINHSDKVSRNFHTNAGSTPRKGDGFKKARGYK